METWRFLVSLAVMLVVWALVVTVVSGPPGPRSLIVVTVLAAVSLVVSDFVMKRLNRRAE